MAAADNDRAPDTVVVLTVGYREHDDAAEREMRVDVVDARRYVTLASLTPDAAMALAAELLMQGLQARRLRDPQ